MNICLKSITTENYMVCINLTVNDNQLDFVAANAFSLAQAAYEPNLYPLAIYKNDEMVGFILYDFDEEVISWSMSRFMLDVKFQHQGIGFIALQTFIDYFYAKHGKLPLVTSANVKNTAAIKLYEKVGFVRGEEFSYEVNGKTYDEVRLVLHS